ncbi:hypothetical protein Goklo_005558 [Gossypium klotzschianum]|uniref:Transferase family protein n=1 Tax=Gossypium klotzschianum TaxID=34286 RepID=A0A7J8VF64_9ROSI|nr:hypothetical protein [Gossypium klotzschianum]
MDSSTVRIISECFVTPQHVSEESKQPFYLSTWDLVMLSVHYIQKGLLFTKPAPGDYCEQNLINNVLVRLKRSLSITLVHFYPLAGRFATKIEQNPKSHFVCVDCNNSTGAKFIHAAVDMSVSGIVSPTYVPLVVQSFFDHDRAINYEGHTKPLLPIQVTELIDGVFIAQGDTNIKISSSPVLERWFPEGSNGPLLTLPFTHQDEFITRFETPHVLERIFHFSAEARRLPCEIVTRCTLAINNRSRLEPPLSPNYFGNSFQTVTAMTTAGELLEHGLGWAAWKLNQAVVNHTDKSVRGFVKDWLQSPFVYQSSPHLYPRSLIIGSSPRFNMYGNEFGLGKALTLRSGYGNKFDGKISPYPGREGEVSVDMEIFLPPFSMNALESDEEFMAAVSAPI